MFKTRLISGIFLVIAALLTIISGGYVLFVTLLCVSLLGIQELYKAMGVHKDGVGLLELAGYLGTILYYASLLLGFERYGMMAVLLGLVLLMFVYVFTYPKYEADQVMSAFFGIVYVAVMLSFIFLTRNLEGGKFLVWLIFLCSWGCDTCAYCVGMLIGKHKMAPVLSPKKSVEGAVGRCCGSSSTWRDLCGCDSWTDSGICSDLCSRCTDLYGRRSCCICDQEKSRHQGLRQADPGTWRHP